MIEKKVKNIENKNENEQMNEKLKSSEIRTKMNKWTKS